MWNLKSREILESIDHHVAEAQNIQRLTEIQRNLDTSGIERVNDKSLAEYKERDFDYLENLKDGQTIQVFILL